jgi:hypothetical protein
MADSSRAATVRKAAMALVQQPMALLPRRPAMASKARLQVLDLYNLAGKCCGTRFDQTDMLQGPQPGMTCEQGRIGYEAQPQ